MQRKSKDKPAGQPVKRFRRNAAKAMQSSAPDSAEVQMN